MGLLNSFCCCCYWCGSPMGGLDGEEPFEESLKGSCVHLPRHSSAAWREFSHDPAFIFFSLWCLSYCRQGRIRSVFPKINWFDCLLEHRATPGSHLDFAGWAAGLVLRQQWGKAPCSASSIHLEHSSRAATVRRALHSPRQAKWTIFQQTEEQEMNGLS